MPSPRNNERNQEDHSGNASISDTLNNVRNASDVAKIGLAKEIHDTYNRGPASNLPSVKNVTPTRNAGGHGAGFWKSWRGYAGWREPVQICY